MKKKKSNKIVFIIIGIILLILIGVIVTQKKEDNSSTPLGEDDIINEDNRRIDMNNEENVEVNNGTKTNVSEALKKDHYIQIGLEENVKYNKDIVISDIKISASYEKDSSTLTAKITNNTKESYDPYVIFVYFFDKEGNSIYAEEYHIDNFKRGSTKDIKLTARFDFSNANDVKFMY